MNKKRLWFHGTSHKKYFKIKKSGCLIPFLSDNYSVGKAIWFTSDIEEAKQFGNIVLIIKHKDLMKFKHKRFSPYPYGFIKKFKIESPDSYEAVVFEKVPLKCFSQNNSK